ncbi:MAG TPA: sigma 54-interacting transcriptional regulator [Terriglobales bacterium]|nr:sigma 54-interacting transcriptional regulator [Terriglobales bacterium]
MAALRASGILDTAPERSFDQLAELAASICGTPVAVVSLIDSDRQWFKSKLGLSVTETSRDIAFCAHAIVQGDLFVVPDAAADQRFAGNPLVTSDPHIRFYAGAPLITAEGHALGTLCVLDHVPRQLTDQQREALRVLSSQAVAQIELRKTKAELRTAETSTDSVTEALRASEEFKGRLLACSRDCIKVLDLEGRLVYMNEGGMQSLEICDLAPVLNSSWIDFWDGEDREAARVAVDSARRGETGRFTGYFETRVTRQPRCFDVIVSPIFDSTGRPERILALSRDVTAQKTSEAALRDAIEFNKAIIQDAGEGVVVYDRELRYKVFNPYMERLTGKPANQVLGKIALEVFPRLRLSGIEVLLKRALAGEVVKISDVVVPKHSAQGQDVWESCTFAPQYDADGNIIGVIGLVFDVTDRHLSEETFRAIVVGTASATGSDFFPSLVKHMAAALRVRYAFITSCDDAKRAKALAFWKGDDFGETFEFDLEGTPCQKVVQGEICHYRDELTQLFPLDIPLAELGCRSYLGVPMLDQSGRVIGHIAIIDDKPMERDERAVDLVKIFAARAAAELKRQRAEIELQAALQQVQELQKKLEAENVYLREEIRKEHNFEEIVGNSKGLLDVLRKVETVAPTDSTVLILGETGCGKELIARAIHNRSKRKNRPLVKVNCGAIPTGLVESELFGHMKGAFTGALERRIGRFELADGGSLFLDEVSELPLDTQVKLLRVLQEHEFEPLGSSRTIKVNVRIIAASNRDLERAVQEGRFRADLFYRLNVLPVTLPALRDRRADIPLLASFFVDRFSRQFGKQINGISQETMDVLSRYSWPGNIRELQNVIERAVVLCSGSVLRLGNDLLPISSADSEALTFGESTSPPAGNSPSSLENVERSHILQVLQETRGVIEGPRGAARILNLHPNTLRSRMKKLGIERSSATA